MTSSPLSTLPPLELALKPDAAEAQERLRAYWQGEIVDRACASVRAPKDGARVPRRSLIVAEDFDLPGAIEQFQQRADLMFFGGEAMPALMPNYGPDQWAGQVRHLDDLLALPRLHTIQWIPGAGQPPAPAWIEMLRGIQKAGKSVQVLVTVEELKALYPELQPQKTFYWVQRGRVRETHRHCWGNYPGRDASPRPD